MHVTACLTIVLSPLVFRCRQQQGKRSGTAPVPGGVSKLCHTSYARSSRCSIEWFKKGGPVRAGVLKLRNACSRFLMMRLHYVVHIMKHVEHIDGPAGWLFPLHFSSAGRK